MARTRGEAGPQLFAQVYCSAKFPGLWRWVRQHSVEPGRKVHIHEYFHQMNTATAAGTIKITEKIGNSSATEYPARETPTHILIAATPIRTGIKLLPPIT